MKRFLLAALMICGPAAAQQVELTADQCVFNTRALTVYRAQREAALDEVVNVRTRVGMLEEQVISAQARVRELEQELAKLKEGQK